MWKIFSLIIALLLAGCTTGVLGPRANEASQVTGGTDTEGTDAPIPWNPLTVRTRVIPPAAH